MGVSCRAGKTDTQSSAWCWQWPSRVQWRGSKDTHYTTYSEAPHLEHDYGDKSFYWAYVDDITIQAPN